VWLAEQISLRRKVAVKFVRPEFVTERQLELFAREARAGGRLNHPGIVTVNGHGRSEGLAWIAMEYVDGAWNLRDFIDEVGHESDVPEGYDRHVAHLVACGSGAWTFSTGASISKRHPRTPYLERAVRWIESCAAAGSSTRPPKHVRRTVPATRRT